MKAICAPVSPALGKMKDEETVHASARSHTKWERPLTKRMR
jgi:hypothetical protein